MPIFSDNHIDSNKKIPNDDDWYISPKEDIPNDTEPTADEIIESQYLLHFIHFNLTDDENDF
jgi:hypothetical protein